MMHNRIVKTIGLLLLLLTGASYAASPFDEVRYYLGAELSLFNKTAYSSANNAGLNAFRASPSDSKLAIQKNMPGVNLLAGVRFNVNLGMEIGYGWIQKVTSNVAAGNQATNKVKNAYIDLLGYLPVASQVDLLGEVGVGQLMSSATVTGVAVDNLDDMIKSKYGFRVGAGAEFNIDDNWSARGLLRYQKGNKSFLTSLTSFSIGMTYLF